jgi:uncharacterized protein (DUF1501 family)
MHITRRYFLKSTGALAVYCGINPLRTLADVGLTPGDVKPVAKGKTFVAIFLRGGMDGLNFIVPFKDPGYQQLRRTIALGAPGADNGVLDLDGFFGLHPRAAALAPLFKNGTALALHAVGYDLNTRSHFEEQDTWETGVTGNTVNSDGWLNRHLITSQGHGPVRAVSLGNVLPRILRGKAPAFALHGISDLTLPGSDNITDVQMSAALEHAYCTPPPEHASAAQDLLAETAQTTLDGVELIKSKMATMMASTVVYPKTDFGRKLQQVAQLIKADIGLEVAEVDYDGWDTHSNQGNTIGQFGDLSQGFAEGLAAFAKDLGDRLNDTLVLTMSDFGRTAEENGTGGTDHGWANCMIAIGGGLATTSAGGIVKPVLSKWPGLAHEQLHQGRDLLHTTDFRDVLGEVVAVHLGNPQIKTVLPSHDFKPVGLLKGALPAA